MFKFKKIAIALLTVVMVLNLAAAGAFAKPPEGKENHGGAHGKAHLKVTFSDVNGHWAEEYMSAMNVQGIINGYGDATFRPDNSVTQDEAITMIARILKLDVNINAVVVPEAIKADAKIALWAKPYVAMALQRGILNTEDLKNFSSYKEAQRYEVAAWLARALGLDGEAANAMNSALPYVDSYNVPGWAKGYIWVISDQGIMVGYPGKYFHPNKGILRAEMAAMLSRIMNRVAGQLDLQPVKGVVQEVYGGGAPSVTLTVYGNRHISNLPVAIEPAKVKTVTIPMDDDALVYINGKKAELSDLEKGYRATVLVQQDGQAAMIMARATPEELQKNDRDVPGWLTAAQNSRITVLTRDGSKTYTLDSAVEIKIDGKEAGTEDLKVDMMVKLELADGKVKEVNAYRD